MTPLRSVQLILMLVFISVVVPCFSQPVGSNLVIHLIEHRVHPIFKWKYQPGDIPVKESGHTEDSLWTDITSPRTIQQSSAIQWIRKDITLRGELLDSGALGIHIAYLPQAFEVYWNGELIYKNGRVRNSPDEEVPGTINSLFKIPIDATKAGHHALAIRFSNHSPEQHFKGFRASIGYFSELLKQKAHFFHDQYVWFGVFLTVSIISLTLSVSGKKYRSFIFFALFCLCYFINNVIDPAVDAYQVKTSAINFIIGLQFLIFPLSGLFLNVFFLYNYNVPNKWIHIILIVAIKVMINVVFPTLIQTDFHKFITSSYLVGILLYAVLKKKAGSAIALFGVTALTIAIHTHDIYYRDMTLLKPLWSILPFNLTLLFLFCIILSISRQILEENRQIQIAQNRSHRLETQLLKSQIQPHFISNTLHSIKSWFRENPQKAGRLIQTLADEFRLISQISSEKLIAIEEELTLCRYHLELMSHRREVVYELEVDPVPQTEMVPPLIFHTLIENGLTHAYTMGENGKFQIRFSSRKNEKKYTVLNDGSLLKELSSQPKQRIEAGMGLSYVKARLEESYPSQWQLDYGLKDGLWEVNIIIKV